VGETAIARPNVFDISQWLPTEEVHRRLCQPLGNRHQAARDLTVAHATSVRTMRRWLVRPTQPKLCDIRLWLVKFELQSWSDGLLVVYRLHRPTFGINPVRRLRGYIFFDWVPDLARVWPKIFEPPSPPRRLTAKEWIVLEAQRLKRLDEIPVGIKKRDFAKLLKKKRDEAAKDSSLEIGAADWPYIANHLQEWDLWPIARIQ